MTFTATLTLDEAAARALTEAISDDPLLGDQTMDLYELKPGRWQVTVYFADAPDEATKSALASAVRRIPGRKAGKFDVTELPDADWVAQSLDGLAPVRVGRFLVYGAHDRDKVLPNDLPIEIEAGQAFGTGHHGTTAGCLAAIDQLAKRRHVRRALDAGTGSGVLAIAIARLCKTPVVASDNDPVATRVAAENVRLNNAVGLVRVVTADGVSRALFRANGPYDLIVANILAGPLVALAPAIRRITAPGGTVILSGLLDHQTARVASAYRGQGLRPIDATLRDGWRTLTLERPPKRKGRRP